MALRLPGLNEANPNSAFLTPEQIERQRAIAQALQAQGMQQQPITHWGQGVGNILSIIGGKMKEGQLDRAEAANAQSSSDRIAALLSGVTGGNTASGATGAGLTAVSPGAGGTAASMPTGERAAYIKNGLVMRGMPEHVADAFVLNFQDESGLNPGINEANPIVPGSRGGFGLYQLTGPRRRAYEQYARQQGVPLDDVDAQLDFLMLEGQGPEAKAFEQIMSAPDTGTAAAAIVNKFLRPSEKHRSSREARYLAYGRGTEARPEGTATAAIEGITNPYAAAGVTDDQLAGMNAGMPAAPLPMPGDEQIAQALGPRAVPSLDGARIDVPDVVAPQQMGIPPAAPGGSQVMQEPIPERFGYPPSDVMTPGAPAAQTDAGRRVVEELLGGAPMTGGGAMPMQPPGGDAMPMQQPAQPPIPRDPEVIPPGMHAMPSGELMADADMPDGGYGTQTMQVPQAAPQAGGQMDDATALQLLGAQAAPPGSGPFPAAPGTGGAVMQPQQPAQAQGGINPAIIASLSNPNASEQERAIAGMLFQQQMQQMQPREPQPLINAGEGQLYDPNTGQWIQAPGAGAPTATPMTPEQRQQWGIPAEDTRPYAMTPEGPKLIGDSKGISVTTNVGGGDKFFEELDKEQATIFSGASQAGIEARSKLGQINRLEDLLADEPGGLLSAGKAIAGNYGINIEGMDNVQAAQALISQLVPQQRPPGSGPMSDADLELFKQSLPRLINQPGGNQRILNTMRAIAQYEIQMGEIADQVADRSITPADARKLWRELENPLEFLQEAEGGKRKTSTGVEWSLD